MDSETGIRTGDVEALTAAKTALLNAAGAFDEIQTNLVRKGFRDAISMDL